MELKNTNQELPSCNILEAFLDGKSNEKGAQLLSSRFCTSVSTE
jgi:hypothetical protein